MKYCSWNVNGIRAVVNKSVFLEYLDCEQPDVIGLQEVKCTESEMPIFIELHERGYEVYWNAALRKGYSGTAILSRISPVSVTLNPEGGDEGRVIVAEFSDIYFVNVYTPNAKRDLSRLEYRTEWDRNFRNYLIQLSAIWTQETSFPDIPKGVVVCGDLNVAHREIDLTHPATNHGNAGFTDAERAGFSTILDAGFTDTFRHFFPDRTEAYTWWSNFSNSRAKNVGWRIDYLLVSA